MFDNSLPSSTVPLDDKGRLFSVCPGIKVPLTNGDGLLRLEYRAWEVAGARAVARRQCINGLSTIEEVTMYLIPQIVSRRRRRRASGRVNVS